MRAMQRASVGRARLPRIRTWSGSQVVLEDRRRAWRRMPDYRMAESTPEIWYMPFAGNWRDPRRWRNEMRRSPRGVVNALEGLGLGLPDKIVFGTNWTGHQMLADLSARRERWRIIETGAMLSLLPLLEHYVPEDYASRLIRPDKYLEACAELRGGFLFYLLGFRLVRDPVNTLRDRKTAKTPVKGPDWGAYQGSHAFGVEVICPDESDDALGRLKFFNHSTIVAMGLLRGRNVKISVNPAAVREATNRDWFSAKQADKLVLDAAIAALGAHVDSAVSTELGTIEIAKPGSGTMIGPIPVDEDRELERLRGQLVVKAGQLGEFGEPGIIVVDSSQDSAVMRRCCAVAAMIEEGRDSWASNLACVMLVTSTWPGFAITIVMGPRYDAFEAASVRGLRVCGRGHFHVDAFGRSPQDCPLDRYDNFPTFCGAKDVARRGRRR